MTETVKKPEIENGIQALPYTVVKIEGRTKHDLDRICSGTGFFFHLEDEGGSVMMIATNKHVIEGQDYLTFHMGLADEYGKRIFGPAELVSVDTAKYPIVLHPDPNVDLALIAAEPVLKGIRAKGKEPYYLPLTKDNFPPEWLAKELNAFTNVIMIGFPDGLMDVANNLPISRRGIMSTHYYADYNGAKNFVVDIAAFGGSSGSPVFAYFEGFEPTEIGRRLGNSAIYFIGILHSGPTLSAEGKVVPEAVMTSGRVTKTELMMHLGICAKVDLLHDFAPLVKEIITSNEKNGNI